MPKHSMVKAIFLIYFFALGVEVISLGNSMTWQKLNQNYKDTREGWLTLKRR